MSTYIPSKWQNNQAPAINDVNLDHMEAGIESAHVEIEDRVITKAVAQGEAVIPKIIAISESDYNLITPISNTLYIITEG